MRRESQFCGVEVSVCGKHCGCVLCGFDETHVFRNAVCARRSGAVFSWGKNLFGQLGINTTQNQPVAVQLSTLRNRGVRYIACGDDFSVFLTLDGNVYTCGSGTYGQLGHGTMQTDMLPRAVLELMGTQCTQISCGGRHTLVFVPSRGRIYGFGLGGAGQLGLAAMTNASLPQVVRGPWVSVGMGGGRWLGSMVGLDSKWRENSALDRWPGQFDQQTDRFGGATHLLRR